MLMSLPLHSSWALRLSKLHTCSPTTTNSPAFPDGAPSTSLCSLSTSNMPSPSSTLIISRNSTIPMATTSVIKCYAWWRPLVPRGGNGQAFRSGGEEFAIVFPNTSAKDAFEHLDSLRRIIETSTLPIARH